MTMSLHGVSKTIEECGELIQILGKKLAYWDNDNHPDGMPISTRIENEMADVIAAIEFTAPLIGLDIDRILARKNAKLATFEGWHDTPGNNLDGVLTPDEANPRW